jgi:hypothetical protein
MRAASEYDLQVLKAGRGLSELCGLRNLEAAQRKQINQCDDRNINKDLQEMGPGKPRANRALSSI